MCYCSFLREVSQSEPQVFMCHFYNTYFAHTAGGRMIGSKVSQMILDNKQLNFYKYDSDVKELLGNVRDSINEVCLSFCKFALLPRPFPMLVCLHNMPPVCSQLCYAMPAVALLEDTRPLHYIHICGCCAYIVCCTAQDAADTCDGCLRLLKPGQENRRTSA